MTNNDDKLKHGNFTGTGANGGQGGEAKDPGTKDQGNKNSRSFTAAGSGNGIDKAKEVAGSLVQQAKSTAGDAYNAVADKASTLVDDKKTDLTLGLTGVAETVRKVSGVLQEGEAPAGMNEYAARYTASAAKKLESAASYFEQTDLKGMVGDLETLARKNPAIFLGTAFALGVFAARLFKSAPVESEGGSVTTDLKRLPDSTTGGTEDQHSSAAL